MKETPLDSREYVKIAAQLLNLQLREEHREGVVENWDTIAQNAQLVNEFSLTDEVEPAPIFEP